jgi:ABC-2 type transport system permease protein
MSWNWRAMRAIMRKDLKQVFQNKMVWMPFIIVPAILLVALPLFLVLLPSLAGPGEFDDVATLLNQMPSQLREGLSGLSGQQMWVVVSSNYMFAPMFLIVPLMVSSILGADSFAGEKERKTLEGLLYTPVTDSELFVAKLLVALLPALAIDVASFVLYGLVVNLSGYRVMERIFFPTPTWWALVFWLGPGVAVAGLGTTVLISSKAKTFMQAQQASGALVLPIVFLMIGQISGLFFFGVELILIVGLAMWSVGIWLIWIGAKTVSRGELIARI